MAVLAELPEAFHEAFSELGWLISESTSVDTAKAALSAHRVLTRLYVDIFCLCSIGIVKEFITVISNLFILTPESIPSF